MSCYNYKAAAIEAVLLELTIRFPIDYSLRLPSVLKKYVCSSKATSSGSEQAAR
jgi:hypothetical protein